MIAPDIYAIIRLNYIPLGDFNTTKLFTKLQGKRDDKETHFEIDTQMKLCGRNNHTYHSWCQMIKDSCNTGYFIDIEHNGECSASNSKLSKL